MLLTAENSENSVVQSDNDPVFHEYIVIPQVPVSLPRPFSHKVPKGQETHETGATQIQHESHVPFMPMKESMLQDLPSSILDFIMSNIDQKEFSNVVLVSTVLHELYRHRLLSRDKRQKRNLPRCLLTSAASTRPLETNRRAALQSASRHHTVSTLSLPSPSPSSTSRKSSGSLDALDVPIDVWQLILAKHLSIFGDQNQLVSTCRLWYRALCLPLRARICALMAGLPFLEQQPKSHGPCTRLRLVAPSLETMAVLQVKLGTIRTALRNLELEQPDGSSERRVLHGLLKTVDGCSVQCLSFGSLPITLLFFFLCPFVHSSQETILMLSLFGFNVLLLMAIFALVFLNKAFALFARTALAYHHLLVLILVLSVDIVHLSDSSASCISLFGSCGLASKAVLVVFVVFLSREFLLSQLLDYHVSPILLLILFLDLFFLRKIIILPSIFRLLIIHLLSISLVFLLAQASKLTLVLKEAGVV